MKNPPPPKLLPKLGEHKPTSVLERVPPRKAVAAKPPPVLAAKPPQIAPKRQQEVHVETSGERQARLQHEAQERRETQERRDAARERRERRGAETRLARDERKGRQEVGGGQSAAMSPARGRARTRREGTASDPGAKMACAAGVRSQIRRPSGTSPHAFKAVVTVSSSGALLSARLSGSSGSSDADQAALSAIQSSGPFPRCPGIGSSMTIILPFR